jgi:hypothetical protein
MLFRPTYGPLRGEETQEHLSWTARNSMERGPPCEEDPALPGLFTLIEQL